MRRNFTHRRRQRWFGNRASPGPSTSASRYVKKAENQAEQEVYVATHQFNDFPVSQQIKDNIAKHGYTTPMPIQDQVIPHVLSGRDVVGIANTGTGKTAAFLVPLLDKTLKDSSQRALIVVPTRELAIQIEDELQAFAKALNIGCVLCIGGASIHRQISSLRSQTSFVIGTPGRLIDLTRRRILNLSRFQNIVLDEVDRMVDIGFIKDVKYLISLLPQERQSLFFSATVSGEIQGIINSFLTNPIIVSVKTAETAQNIEQDVIYVHSKEEKLTKLNNLLRDVEFKKVIIFGRTKWTVERLARTLQDFGFQVESIHGNKSQNQRQRALSLFKQDRLQILVATDIAARGLDIDNITHVINFDEPTNYTDYVHRIGRTGRANKAGKALTFVS